MVKRTKLMRQKEVRPIIEKLTELNLNASDHPELQLLFSEMKRYVDSGERIELNIPFPAKNTIIEGVLETDTQRQVWVKLAKTVG
jgi:hypothetical protein